MSNALQKYIHVFFQTVVFQSVFFQSVWAQTFLFKVYPTAVPSLEALRVYLKFSFQYWYRFFQKLSKHYYWYGLLIWRTPQTPSENGFESFEKDFVLVSPSGLSAIDKLGPPGGWDTGIYWLISIRLCRRKNFFLFSQSTAV